MRLYDGMRVKGSMNRLAICVEEETELGWISTSKQYMRGEKMRIMGVSIECDGIKHEFSFDELVELVDLLGELRSKIWERNTTFNRPQPSSF